MSIPRFITAACVVIVAALCTPAALVPVFNSADVIVIAAPFVLGAVVIWPRRRMVRPPRPDTAPHSPAGDTPRL